MSEAEHVSYCPPFPFPSLWFMPVWFVEFFGLVERCRERV